MASISLGRRLLANVACRTDAGRKRSTNEDTVCAEIRSAAAEDVAVLAVADGMGGAGGGELASRLAIDGLRGAVDLIAGAGEGWPERQLEQLRRVMGRMRDRLHSEVKGHPELSRMGTTLTVAIVGRATMVFSHVGDSRLYLWRSQSLRQLTTDHTVTQELIERRVLTPEAAKHHTARNVLTRCLTPAAEDAPDLGRCEVFPGDVVLGCSDGLHRHLSDEDLAATLVGVPAPDQRDVAVLVDRLVAEANARGGLDNISVFVAALPLACQP
jgi:serine/threonine protein phosphatase PrpC